MKKTDVTQPVAMASAFAEGVYSASSTSDFEIPIPTSTDPNDTCVLDDGFLPITSVDLDNGGIAPERKNFNGMFYLSTDQRFYLQNGGFITYDANVATAIGGYPQDAILGHIDSFGVYKLVRSLIDDNTNNFILDETLIDGTHWEEIKMGGSSRNIGEIVTSTIPLTDAGLHLLDGALLQYGSYQAFIDYIADIYDSGDYSDLFETEANWQTSVTTYGSCGKFVYDSVNNTVRLPKISDILQGTTDVTALGDLIEAGLPNILATWNNGYGSSGGTSGAVQSTSYSSTNEPYQGSWHQNMSNASFDASRSSSIYGNSNTVQPQAIKVLYYIVIATSAKTEIEVDIDEIATDLNGKADVDLSNITATGKNTISIQVIPDYKNRQTGVTALDTWKTVTVNSWVSITTTTTANNRTLFICLRDENGNDIDGVTDLGGYNGIMRAQQYSAGARNQVFCYVPKGYSYKGKIDSNQTFGESYEYPLKGAN